MDQPFQSSLEAAVLSEWFVKESMTLLAPDGGANVIFSSEPLDPTIHTQQYAKIQGDLLQSEFNGYHEMAFYPELIFKGRPGFVREFEWIPEDGNAVRQIQYYYTTPGRGYTATATTPSTSFDSYESPLRTTLKGLVIRDF